MKEIKEVQKVLEELIGSKPEKLTGEAKRLFEAIMKIADERDELLKERQADKEKIKEYAELLIKVNVQNLNNSIEQRKESNEQLEALHEGWKIELEKKDNRIKELEYEKENYQSILHHEKEKYNQLFLKYQNIIAKIAKGFSMNNTRIIVTTEDKLEELKDGGE